MISKNVTRRAHLRIVALVILAASLGVVVLPGAWPHLLASFGLLKVEPEAANPSVHELTLPLKKDSVRFAVIGDSGTGDSPQYQTAQELARYHDKFPFDTVLMMGDNIYGSQSPADLDRKFALPYKPLLDGGVKFYASLGNHDSPAQTLYGPFNMGGKRFYNWKKDNVEFFALDSNYMDAEQFRWLDERLRTSGAAWKICFFHHPLYSDGKFHGPDVDLRQRLEPMFVKYGVNLVLSGHEHFYERIQPQRGLYYFILGNSGQLRYHDIRQSQATAKGFDTDRSFMMMEVAGDDLYFQTVSRQGITVDSGLLTKQKPPPSPPSSNAP